MLREWAAGELAFRTGLAQVDIAQLRLVRPLRSFTLEERAALALTLRRVLDSWPRLLEGFPLEPIRACFEGGPGSPDQPRPRTRHASVSKSVEVPGSGGGRMAQGPMGT